MASYRKNKNGTTTATIFVGRDAKGKQTREYITHESSRELKKIVAKRESELRSCKINDLADMKFSDYADKWFELSRPLLATGTRKTYKQYIEKDFKPFFGNTKVRKITETNIMEYIAEKLDGSKKLSPTTVRKHFFTLSRMFRLALKGNSPCIEVTPPQNAEFKPKVPTDEEFNAICKKFMEKSLLDGVIILLSGWCGLRRGEIWALRWNDFNENDGTLRIDEALGIEEEGYSFEVKDPKSKNGFRTIVVPEKLKLYLVELRGSSDKDELIVNINPHTYSKNYNKIFKDNMNELTKVRFHDLRHYHASTMYKKEIPDLYAAERLGHDITVLKKIYQHLDLKIKSETDDKIKNMF